MTKYSKGGEGLGTEILEGGDLFEGGAGGDTFYIKNKLKSEIFKSKKKKNFLGKFFFSAMTKNLNWEI